MCEKFVVFSSVVYDLWHKIGVNRYIKAYDHNQSILQSVPNKFVTGFW